MNPTQILRELERLRRLQLRGPAYDDEVRQGIAVTEAHLFAARMQVVQAEQKLHDLRRPLSSIPEVPR